MIATILRWLLALFFSIGAAINAWAPTPIREEFARLGFSGWFHWLVALLEVAAAAIIAWPLLRLYGFFLGVAVMARRSINPGQTPDKSMQVEDAAAPQPGLRRCVNATMGGWPRSRWVSERFPLR